MLKVRAGLADLTLLNHRNTREGAPCVAGRCREFKPGDILGAGKASCRSRFRSSCTSWRKVDGLSAR